MAPTAGQLLAGVASFRFRYLFKQTTHEMATRFCFIDYDREIAIVAELEEDEERKLIGVGRLVADADHTNAEYAVLVAAAYQGIRAWVCCADGCLELWQSLGHRYGVVRKPHRQTQPLAHIFEDRGFELDRHLIIRVVLGSKSLASS